MPWFSGRVPEWCRPPASQTSVHRMAGPPALVTMATRWPRRQRLVAEGGGEAEHLFQRVDADHSRLLEQGVDGDLLRPVQRCATSRPGRRLSCAALDRDDRLADD